MAKNTKEINVRRRSDLKKKHPISLKSNLLYENNKYLTIVSPKLEVQNVDDRQIELLIARKEKNRGFYSFLVHLE